MLKWSALFAVALCAQTPDTATIRGRVLDQSHAAVSGVHVAAVNTLTGVEGAAETDFSGAFFLAGLPVAGDYNITAGKQGFGETHLSKVALAGGTTADLTLELSVAGGQT